METTIREDFDALEAIIEKMDDTEVSLEDSFALYEDGMKLLKQLSGRIDTVEERVKKLSEDGSVSDLDE
ncbi:MAG: exodeoxyribonuclease VII small subunit [Lachnospiraceae bacterium]|nr:exodeoxyribonuclease VII small subunit [Lachnospiraceae bacterium]